MEEQLPQLRPFDIPNLQLPSYEDFGKRASDVFTKDGEKLVPRKPSLMEEMRTFGERNATQPNLQRATGEYSRAESQGFNNPVLPYDPTLNMSDVYAKYDPATWSKSFEKFWDTTVNNTMSGYQNLYHGLTEGISQGRLSAVWDNEYSRHLAEVTENLEKMKPLYFTEDDQGTSAFLKQLLPSVGYVASSVAEMAATHLALTLGGAAIGAVAGEGIGAIPGAIAGNVAALVKDAATLKNMVTGIGNAARTINTLSTANKIKNGAQLIGTGLFSANGEAALNAQMASRNLLEDKKRKYYEETGRYLSGEELDRALEDSNKSGSTVFSLNLPLIAASQMLQFGNLLRGKAAPAITESLAFGIDKTGKAVAKSAALKVGGKFLLDTGAEGFEEFAQGVIEDATTRHFTKLKENRDNYLSEFIGSAYKRAGSKEGFEEFLGGAIIGGVFNAPDLAGYSTVSRNTKRFVDDYNQSTHNYFHALGDAVTNNDRLKSAIMAGDRDQVSDLTLDYTIDMVNAHSKAGSTQAFADTLQAMEDMDLAEFNKSFGLNVSEQEKLAIVQTSLDSYKRVSKIRQDVDTAYQVNPFGSDDWFNNQLNKFRSEYTVDRKAANAVWDIFKDTLTYNTVRYDSTLGTIKEMRDYAPAIFPGYETLIGTNPSEIVSNYKNRLRQTILAGLPGFETERAMLDRLESGDPKSQYATILSEEDKKEPGMRDFVQRYNRELILSEVLLSKNTQLQSRKGQRKEIKRIIDYMRAFEAQIISEPVTSPPVSASAPVVTPTASTPVTPVIPATPITPTLAPAAPIIPEPAVSEDLEDLEEVPYYPDTDEEDYARLFGEGETEETKTSRAPEKVAPERPVIIDPALDSDISVDEPVLAGVIDGLGDNETLNLEKEGVNLTYKGKRIKRITKKGDTFVGETETGPIELTENPVPSSEIEAIEDVVGRYKADNSLNETQSIFLDKLLENYAEIKC